ncbi:MAG TPA: hypothetical protein VGK59_01280 [Ohtaekwangia sp.]
MKVQAKNFKGIEYIQVNQLPKDQYEKFQLTINKSLFIKILIDGKVISGCVQYKDYSLWYEGVYMNGKPVGVEETVVKSSVSLNKA